MNVWLRTLPRSIPGNYEITCGLVPRGFNLSPWAPSMANVGFAVGTGRCGTKFLATVLAADPAIASHHERHAFSDTFHRFCTWYQIPVDDAGFIAAKRRAIEADLSARSYSFEASAFLALSLAALHEHLDAKIVLMVRSPEKVVASYLRKGWFENDPILDDPALPPTMQDVAMPHHFLGRTMPVGDEFVRWRQLTRVGKIAWFWGRLNAELLNQAKRLPREATRLQKLETLDFAAFCELRNFLGAPENVTKSKFEHVRKSRPNASRGAHTLLHWTVRERHEFEAEVRYTAEALDYPWSVEELTPELRAPSGGRTKRWWNLRGEAAMRDV